MVFTREGAPLIRAWVLYDADCAFCTRWAEAWKATLIKRGILIAPLQAEWIRARFHWDDATMLRDIRVLTADGELIAGAAAYRHVARKIWWTWPVFAIFSLPGFKFLMERGYRWFAEHRHCVSNACRIDAKPGRHAH